MSRVWIFGLVVVAGVAMWLAVSWPSAEKSAPQATAEATDADAPRATKSASRPLALQPDAAAPGADEPAYDEPAAPVQAAAPSSNAVKDFMPGERGPIQEYQALYDKHPRDSEATTVETTIRSAFNRSSRPDLFHSTSCHEQVCRVLIRWSPDRKLDYIAAMRGLALGMAWPPGQPGFESQIAINTASEKDKDGGRLVELFIKRRSPTAAKPTFVQGER